MTRTCGRITRFWAALCGIALLGVRCEAQIEPVPKEFPRFEVPGHEREMDDLRAMYWLHYTGAAPKSTMWDEWLPEPALWPAISDAAGNPVMRPLWKRELSARIIDAEGYVSTHQHHSLGHPLGWPFPFWNQGQGWGWHFSFQDTAPQNAQSLLNGTTATPSNWLWLGIGALLTFAMISARARFAGFPLHPIGYLLALTAPTQRAWLSFFLGWLFKTLVTRFGGHTAYRKLLPAFLGLLLGEVFMMLLWLLIDAFTGRIGHQLLM